MRIRHVILLAVFLGVAADAAAQTGPAERRWTFGGTLGIGNTWDDEGGMGKGWLAGGYAARGLTTKTDLELALDVQRHDRRPASAIGWQSTGHTTYLSAALLRRFGSRSANCFLLGGGALGIHRGESGFPDDPPLMTNESTKPGLIFGGGLSFRTGNGIEISTPIRITMMAVDDDSDPVSSFMAALRIGF